VGITRLQRLLVTAELPDDPGTDYTPVIAQGAATNISKTISYAKYVRRGRLVKCWGRCVLTANGASGFVTVSLPVTGISARHHGTFWIEDAGVQYVGSTWFASASTICGYGYGAVGPMGNNNPFITLASGDAVAWDLEYVAAA